MRSPMTAEAFECLVNRHPGAHMHTPSRVRPLCRLAQRANRSDGSRLSVWQRVHGRQVCVCVLAEDGCSDHNTAGLRRFLNVGGAHATKT